MAIVLWAGLRQLESLRTAMISNVVAGRFSLQFRGSSFSDLEKWIDQEGFRLDDFLHGGESVEEARASQIKIQDRLNIGLIQTTRFQLGDNRGTASVEGSRTTASIAPETDYGRDRSSAGWDREPNLLTSSILIRLLATLEQFEIDALKSLLFYRPSGRGTPSAEYQEEEVEEEFIFENPEHKKQVDYYNFPPLWTWIKRSAEDRTHRRSIFSRVYGIKFRQPHFGLGYDDLYEMRNAIAHGRKRVDVPIGMIFNIDAYVANTMIELRDSVYADYRLIL